MSINERDVTKSNLIFDGTDEHRRSNKDLLEVEFSIFLSLFDRASVEIPVSRGARGGGAKSNQMRDQQKPLDVAFPAKTIFKLHFWCPL